MNPNDNKNNRKNNKPGGNWRGVASLVGWALLLTIIFSYASSVMGSRIRPSCRCQRPQVMRGLLSAGVGVAWVRAV